MKKYLFCLLLPMISYKQYKNTYFISDDNLDGNYNEIISGLKDMIIYLDENREKIKEMRKKNNIDGKY